MRKRQGFSCFLAGVFLLFAITLMSCSQPGAVEDAGSVASIRVVMDNNYPPYVFEDENGNLRGILIDQWKLWQERTGVKVEITALPWVEAMDGMEAGQFDVIDTIFYTDERAELYDFTKPYAEIDVRIFFQKNISGLAGAADLRGFRVAVKSGDANAEYLLDHGVKNLVYYNSYEEIIRAAAAQEEAIFVIDQPPGLYFLYKYNIQNQFTYSDPLYGGEFHRAVKKGDSIILSLVNQGFSRISQEEYKDIDRHWLGVSTENPYEKYLPYMTLGGVIIALVIFALFFFNRILQARIHHRTVELQDAVSMLQSSESRFREAVDFLPIPISISEDDGKMWVVNRKFTENYGYILNDIPTADSWMENAYPEPGYREQVRAIWDQDVTQSIKSGNSTPLREYKVTCKDGSLRDVEIVTHPVGKLWVAAFNDVTERNQSEKNLRLFKESVENATDAIGMSTPQGVHYYQNEAFSQLFGDVGDNPSATLYVDENIGKDVFETIKAGEQWIGEAKMYAKDKSILNIFLRAYANMDDSGQIIGLVGIHTDISERKKIEDALRESEIIFSSFLEHSPVYVFFKDKNIRALRLSKNYEQMLGMPLGELLGKNMDELFPSELAKSMVADDMRILNEGKRILVTEEFNGRIYETTKFPIRKDGKPEMLAGFTLDVTERKQAEQALQESEENYRSLVELSPDGIVVHRDGIVVFANSASAKLMHAGDVSELLGKPVIDFVHPDERTRVLRRIHKMTLEGTKAPAMEEKFIRLDGTIIDVEVVAMAINYEGRIAVQVVVRDITERKQMLDSLKASEEKYRTLIDTINTGIFMSSLDGKFLQANSALVEMSGYESIEEFMQISAQRLYANFDDRDKIIDEVKNQGFIKNRELLSLKKDGSTYWISLSAVFLQGEDGKPGFLLGSVSDITERKRAEQAIQQSERRFRTLIENSHDALALLAEDGTILYEGPTVRRITGYEPSERIGKNALESIYPEDMPIVVQSLAKVLGGANNTVTAQFRSRKMDGTVWWTEATATNLLHDPTVQAIVVNYRDITAKKQADEQLRESENRFRQIVESSPMGMHIYELNDADDSLIFAGANSAADRILGVDNSQFLGKTIEEAFPPLAATEVPQQYRLVARHGNSWEQVQINYKHGSINGAYELHAFQTGQNRMAVMFLDITDRKQAEAALRKSEERNRAIVAALPDLLFQIDLTHTFLDCVAADPSKLLLLPYQVIGRKVEDLFPQDVAELVAVKIIETLESSEMQVFSYSLMVGDKKRHFEGRMTLLDEESVLALIRDITDSNQFEQALRESEQRYRTLFEQANDAIFIETQDDKIVDANQRACQMLGYTREELLGMLVSDLIAPENHRSSQAIRQELSQYGQKPFESLDVRKDGTYIPVEVTNSILPDGLALSIVRDITERKHAEDELRKTEAEIRLLNTELEKRVIERTAQLELANKELEAFAYSVSHDLRAPLRAIDGFSRIIVEDYGKQLDGEIQTLLAKVRAESHHMGQLIDALLNLSRMTRAEMRMDRVDLSELAHAIAEELRHSEAGRQVEWVIAEHVTTHGDVRLLRVVMENLIGNAWKFTSKTEAARIEFGIQRLDDELIYFVRDNGAGFNMAYANKLFGAFQRLHSVNEFDGTGIGLATVQRIIYRHGGRVWAESKVNLGATFFFTLG